MKKNKLILIGLIFLFLFSIQFMPQDSNSILMKNPKLAQANNVEIISESPFITRWDFFNQTGVGAEIYNETFDNGDYWDLYGVSKRIINTSHLPTEDTWVEEWNPNNNYGSNVELCVALYGGVRRNTFIKWEFPYLY